MAVAGQEGLVRSSFGAFTLSYKWKNQVQKYLTPEPCVFCPGCAEAMHGDSQVLSPGRRLKQKCCSPCLNLTCAQSNVPITMSPHTICCFWPHLPFASQLCGSP